MDPKTVVWLFMLGVQTVARTVAQHDPQVSTAYTLSTGMQAVQSVSIGQIARLLEIPPSRLKIPANSLVTGGDGTNTPLREALNTACGVRSRVQELAGVWREMPRDLELIVVLKVMRHIQRDSYRWLAVLSGKDSSVLSEKILGKVCLQWEALVISEEAEQNLQEYITSAGLTTNERQQTQIASVTTSEIIMSYFSP